ncbi:HET-domain-containing protein [Hypoxylon cercidicola]|nr:HET-domain-containing protein [Hypoxylon cercidicola]
MRLINVNTLELEEFFGTKTPPYAILSHAWGEEEVTFQDWGRRGDNAIRSKKGFSKIVGACRRARADHLSYLWCDTNCIDKSSSAELTEAINSMFAWYHGSRVCYAYLADVDGMSTFTNSRWFSRGWTLQELLAPVEVVFFDKHWTALGDRKKLAGTLSNITKIHIGALEDRETIYEYSVAQRMSWAAERQTTRPEDIAYCLLGIFDINMPLLYGEESKAFTRLQHEIIKVSADQSILAWDLQDCGHSWTSALARSPSGFRFCGSIVRSEEFERAPYSITNVGISMKLILIPTLMQGVVLVGLNCAKELHKETPQKLPEGTKLRRHFRVWIPLRHLRHDTYARIHHRSSNIFLEHLYPSLVQSTPADLLLSLDTPPALTTHQFMKPAEILRRFSAHAPSGVFIKVASGKLTPHGHAFREVYPLGDVVFIQLKRRDISTSSHQLVSCGVFTIIFSVLWDKNGSLQEWLYTTMFDPKLKYASQMTSQPEWSCLFEAYGHTQTSQCCNSAIAIRSLHGRLQQMNRELLGSYRKEGKDPVVMVEDNPLKDVFGKKELIVGVVFRETPELN